MLTRPSTCVRLGGDHAVWHRMGSFCSHICESFFKSSISPFRLFKRNGPIVTGPTTSSVSSLLSRSRFLRSVSVLDVSFDRSLLDSTQLRTNIPQSPHSAFQYPISQFPGSLPSPHPPYTRRQHAISAPPFPQFNRL